jgi:hypothetical protein
MPVLVPATLYLRKPLLRDRFPKSGDVFGVFPVRRYLACLLPESQPKCLSRQYSTCGVSHSPQVTSG